MKSFSYNPKIRKQRKKYLKIRLTHIIPKNNHRTLWLSGMIICMCLKNGISLHVDFAGKISNGQLVIAAGFERECRNVVQAGFDFDGQ